MCRSYGWVFWAQILGPFFGRFSINMGGLSRNWRKIAKNGPFLAKIHHKSGYEMQVSVIRRGYLSENRAADPRPSASHVPPGARIICWQMTNDKQILLIGIGMNNFSLKSMIFQRMSIVLTISLYPQIYFLFRGMWDIIPTKLNFRAERKTNINSKCHQTISAAYY